MFGTLVSDMQESLTVSDSAITGTLKYLTEGSLINTFGPGNFMALKLSGEDFDDATSIKVGMNPSEGTGLVEIINDPDRNGAFKVTNKNTQRFVIQVTKNGSTTTKEYVLTGLTLAPSVEEITEALTQQNSLFEDRLDGDAVDVSEYEAVSEEDDAYYKLNTEYSDAVADLEEQMDGT